MPVKLNYNDVKSTLENMGHILLDTEYINSKKRLNYICAICGTEANQSYGCLIRGIGHKCDNYNPGLDKMKEMKKFVTHYRHICKQCNNIFYNNRKKATYCSRKCVKQH